MFCNVFCFFVHQVAVPVRSRVGKNLEMSRRVLVAYFQVLVPASRVMELNIIDIEPIAPTKVKEKQKKPVNQKAIPDDNGIFCFSNDNYAVLF